MNNIDRIQEYIQDAVISPLERLMNGDSGEPGVNLGRRGVRHLCALCGRALPIGEFERYATGVHRRVCRHCHWVLHGKKAQRKYRRKQLAALIMKL